MKKYEYKTMSIAQKGWGVFRSREIPELESKLNREGKDGWHLCEVILPSAAFGESDKVILIFERELVA
jgi:hypothetical protein